MVLLELLEQDLELVAVHAGHDALAPGVVMRAAICRASLVVHLVEAHSTEEIRMSSATIFAIFCCFRVTHQ